MVEIAAAARPVRSRNPTGVPAPGVGSVADMKNVMRNAPAGAGPWLRTVFVIVSGRLVAPLAGTVTAITTRSGS